MRATEGAHALFCRLLALRVQQRTAIGDKERIREA
jgi:hypothetical protein